VIRSSPELKDLVPYLREKSETELYQKALEIVCLARVWRSSEPFAPEKKQQMMVDSLASVYQQVHFGLTRHHFTLSITDLNSFSFIENAL
jgi:hypothetical protein